MSKIKWTLEKLQEEADKYETRGEFWKYSENAANAAIDKKIMNLLFENHKNSGYTNRNIPLIWTFEKLQEEANKYENRLDFFKNNKKAYYAAMDKKIIDKLFENHKNNGYFDRYVPRKWTEEKLQEEANKYKTRYEFVINNRLAYNSAIRHKLIDKLFENHKNNGYSDKDAWEINNYVIYAYEFSEINTVYVGLTNNIKKRDNQHLYNETRVLGKFCKENNIKLPNYKILNEKLNSTEAQKQEQYWIDNYKENNWYMLNKVKGGSLGSVVKKWSLSQLKNEAKKYKTRGEFWTNNPTAAGIAQDKKLLNELFKNHENNGYSDKCKKSGYWTIEKLQEEVNKYKNRKELNNKNCSVYKIISNKKLLDELFKNHENNGYIRNCIVKKIKKSE